MTATRIVVFMSFHETRSVSLTLSGVPVTMDPSAPLGAC